MADFAASIAGLISLSVGIFKGCVEGYQIITAARHADKDVSRIRCFLQWEEVRFIEWGRSVHIDGDTALQNQYLPWELIASTLQELQQLFHNGDELRRRYGLEPAPINDQQMVQTEGRKGIAKLWSYASPEVRALRARSARSIGTVQRLRWVALDQDKIQALVSNLTSFNNRLYNVLEAQNRDFIRGALATLLQDLTSRTNYSNDLETVKTLNDQASVMNARAITAAADLKQARISIRYDSRPDEVASINVPKAKVSRLKLESIESVNILGNRELVSYKSTKRNINSWVLLEWKTVSQEQKEKLRRRVESLTLLLERATDPAFNTLRWLGYVAKATGYAYAYELAAKTEENPLPQISSLYDRIVGTARHRPSLTTRINYAQHVSKAVLQLHTAGWLHKSIRSSNILFIPQSIHASQPNAPPHQGPYLVGFEYARADNPLEMTENPTRRPDTDLYRHPDLLKTDRSDFCKAFDLHSLGCVLVELALWETFSTIVDRLPSDGNDWRNIESKKAMLFDDVAFAAGHSYTSAVRLCFFPEKDDNDEEDSDEDASVCNEMEIVRLLKGCQV